MKKTIPVFVRLHSSTKSAYCSCRAGAAMRYVVLPQCTEFMMSACYTWLMINDDCEIVDDTKGDQVVWCTGRKALLGKHAYITGAQLMPEM